MSTASPRDWRTHFVALTAHLRNRGWTRPFLMLGFDLRAPGIIDSAKIAARILDPDCIANDNDPEGGAR